METKEIEIRLLRTNSGQIDGLPKNPRKISKKQLEKLKKSVADAPEMLQLRELIVVENGSEFVVIAGNQRLEAAKAIGMKSVPCKVLAADTPAEKLREYAIKDNLPFGEDDWEVLNAEWDKQELEDWGMETKEDETINPDDFGTEFSLPDGEKSEFGQMTFNVTESQRNRILQACQLAEYCDSFNTEENANKNGASLFLIADEWFKSQNVPTDTKEIKEIKEKYFELRKYLRESLKKSGKTAAEINEFLGTQMAGHYFGDSQWLFPTMEVYERLKQIMDLPRDYFECKKIEKEFVRLEILKKS